MLLFTIGIEKMHIVYLLKKRVGVLLFILVSVFTSSDAQVFMGKFNFSMENKKLYLSETIGFKSYKIDSVLVKNNVFQFDLKPLPIGFYKISSSDSNAFEFIHNKEAIVNFEFSDPKLVNSIKVVQSDENKTLWNYKYYSRQNQALQKKLIISKTYLLKADTTQAKWFQNQLDSLEKTKQHYLQTLCKQFPASYFTKVVGASLPPRKVDGKTEKESFFDNVDFSDETLIRSSIFPATMMKYLEKHTEYTEEGFKQTIQTILAKASKNSAVHEYCLNYLLDLFKTVGPDVVFQHIIEEYLLKNACSETNVNDGMKSLMESYRALMPGNMAPDFVCRTENGKSIKLQTELKKKPLTILFFWSSHCGFCHAAIPELKKLLETNKDKVQVIAFSLDNSKEAWKNYITTNNLNWTNISELKAWDSEAVKLYKVHKTPQMYLLDKKGNIVSKHGSACEITKQLLN